MRTTRIDGTTEQRFWPKVKKGQPDECWLWRAAVARNGYGTFGRDGQTRYAHRVAYELVRGPIPEGLVIDHLCRVRACVNPAHLEAVSLIENLRRIIRKNSLKTECIHGHAFTPANTIVGVDRRSGTPRKRRDCRECARNRKRASLRGGSYNGRKTECVHGHTYTPENTYLHTFRGQLRRSCRECRRSRALPSAVNGQLHDAP